MFTIFTMVIVRLIFLRIHHANLQKGNLEGQEKLSQFLLLVVLLLPIIYNMVMDGDGEGDTFTLFALMANTRELPEPSLQIPT